MALKDLEGNVLEQTGDLVGMPVEPADPFDIPAPPAKAKELPTSKDSAELIEKRVAEKRPAPKPRVTKAAPKAAPAKKDEKLPPKDYTQDLLGLGESAWLMLAGLPFTQPFAVVLTEANRMQLAVAWNEAAQHSPEVRAKIEMLVTGGGPMWIVGVIAASVPIAMGLFELARSPQARENAKAQTQVELYDYAVKKGFIQPQES